MFLGNAGAFVGQLIVREIGSPPELVEEVGKRKFALARAARVRAVRDCRAKPDGNKGNYGHALIVAGSVGKSGAAVMASWAALRVGAGLVTAADTRAGAADCLRAESRR